MVEPIPMFQRPPSPGPDPEDCAHLRSSRGPFQLRSPSWGTDHRRPILRRGRRVLILLVSVLLLTGMVIPFRVEAAFAALPGFKEGDEEEIADRLRQEGELSLSEKLRVGRERYEQRLAFKRALARDMQARLETYQIKLGRTQDVQSASNGAGKASATQLGSMPGWAWCLTGLLAVAAAVLIHRVRRAAPAPFNGV